MESICTQCGLCCDGTLFSFVPIADGDDAATLAVLTIGPRPTDDPAAVFAQPCPALADRCCTVYASRPRTCRTYRCRLLDAVETGAVERESALQIVSTTTAQRDAVRASVPGDTSRLSMATIMKQVQARLDEVSGAHSEDDVRTQLGVAVLRMLLETHFQPGLGDLSTARVNTVTGA